MPRPNQRRTKERPSRPIAPRRTAGGARTKHSKKTQNQHHKRRRPIRKRTRRRPVRLFRILLLLLVLGGGIYMLSRPFLTAKFKSLPHLREQANEAIVARVLPRDTTGRNLTTAEKLADTKELLSILHLNEKKENLDSILQTTNDHLFFEALRGMLKKQAKQVPGARLLTAGETSLLLRNANAGFYTKDSPYGSVLAEPRVADRLRRRLDAEKNAGLDPNKTLQELTQGTTLTGQSGLQLEKENGFQALLRSPGVRQATTSFPSQPSRAKGPTDFPTPHIAFIARGDIAMISGLSFEEGAFEQQKDLLHKMMVEAAAHETILFDLRGAAGNSYRYWTEGILPYLVDATDGASRMVTLHDPEGRYEQYLSFQEALNTFDLSDDVKKIDGPSHDRTLTLTVVPKTDALRAKHIAFLVDRRTGGSAETFADFAHRSDRTTILGTKTAGTAWNLPNFLYALPHSGYVLAVDATKPLENRPLEPDRTLNGNVLQQALEYLAVQRSTN